jgi:hypothetical protein
MQSMVPKESDNGGVPAVSSETAGRRKVHVKPVDHVQSLARLSAARAEAKKVLRDLRSQQKLEAKRHRRLMAKACKLSVTELKQIAEMKQTLLGSGSASSTSGSASTRTSSKLTSAATKAIATGPAIPLGGTADEDM